MHFQVGSKFLNICRILRPNHVLEGALLSPFVLTTQHGTYTLINDQIDGKH